MPVQSTNAAGLVNGLLTLFALAVMKAIAAAIHNPRADSVDFFSVFAPLRENRAVEGKISRKGVIHT